MTVSIHKSVMLNEVLQIFTNKPKTFVDGTLGGAGHLEAILDKYQPELVWAFDLDQSAIKRFETKVGNWNSNIQLVSASFDTAKDVIGNEMLDGVLLDLGLSSDEIAGATGISFSNESDPLDMRFNIHSNVPCAADILNLSSEKNLEDIFRNHGDLSVSQSKRLVEAILRHRKVSAFKIVGDLTAITERSLLAKVFQALRIAVNGEDRSLESGLDYFIRQLSIGGRIAVITFHSGEEEVVSEIFAQSVAAGGYKWLTWSELEGRNFVRPHVREIRDNFRARSAKLFAIEKLS